MPKKTVRKTKGAEDNAPSREQWASIKLLALDVDGVLTDGTVFYGTEGELAKPFFIHDGMGLRLLEAAGIRVAVITSEDSALVHKRVSRLMLSGYRPGMKRKGEALRQLMTTFGVIRSQTAFIGDDVNDAEALELAGLPICTPQAAQAAKARAKYITSAAGGRGAVREVADLIIAAKGLDPVALWQGIHPQTATANKEKLPG